MMAKQVREATSKPDRTRQVIEVKPEQDLALMVLLRGGTDEEAAAAAGVARQTVNGWVNSDPAFVAELNRRRQLVWGAYQDRLRALAVEALDVLGDQLRGADPAAARQVALALYKAAGDMTPTGAADPERIRLQWASEAPAYLDWISIS